MSSLFWNIFWLGWSVYILIFIRRTTISAENRIRSSSTRFRFYFIPNWIRRETIFIARSLAIFVASNSAMSLIIQIANLRNPSFGNGMNYAVVRIYAQNVYPFLIIVLALLFAWYFIRTGYYIAYAPIRIRNRTSQLVTVYIDGRRIGIAGPGKQVRNNRALRGHEEYIIEIKNEQNNSVFNKKLNTIELNRLDWTISLDGLPAE